MLLLSYFWWNCDLNGVLSFCPSKNPFKKETFMMEIYTYKINSWKTSVSESAEGDSLLVKYLDLKAIFPYHFLKGKSWTNVTVNIIDKAVCQTSDSFFYLLILAISVLVKY